MQGFVFLIKTPHNLRGLFVTLFICQCDLGIRIFTCRVAEQGHGYTMLVSSLEHGGKVEGDFRTNLLYCLVVINIIDTTHTEDVATCSRCGLRILEDFFCNLEEPLEALVYLHGIVRYQQSPDVLFHLHVLECIPRLHEER